MTDNPRTGNFKKFSDRLTAPGIKAMVCGKKDLQCVLAFSAVLHGQYEPSADELHEPEGRGKQ